MHTIAIMQPYFLPYFGYFQLINAVDVFVIYDDVQYIKQGWVNRNRAVIGNTSQYFTVPLQKASSNQLIKETRVNHKQFEYWIKKFSKSIVQSYSKAKNVDVGFTILEEIEKNYKEFDSIDQLDEYLIKWVIEYLGIKTEIIKSSKEFDNANLSGAERVIDICKRMNANRYINPIGGKQLYSYDDFLRNDIELQFIECKVDSSDYFYSILHTIMTEDKETILWNLNNYGLG
jgi:hypothetical protein